VTAARLAGEVTVAAAAGAGEIHLHVKDAAGGDTLDGAALTEAGRGREGCARCACRRDHGGVGAAGLCRAGGSDPRWTVLPAFASVNWQEEGADADAAALLVKGVGVEAGLWHAGAMHAWLALPEPSCI
jgi:uncharacterized protein (DUF849 family)